QGASQRDASAGASTAQIRCDASRSMRAIRVARPHPSRRAYGRASLRDLFGIRAPQDEDEHRVLQSSPYSTIQTASLVPAAPFGARGLAYLLQPPGVEGWAEGREPFGCSAEHR